MTTPLYNIRMRASRNGKHLSGAERIVAGNDIDRTVKELTNRAEGRGALRDDIIVTVEVLNVCSPRLLTALDVITVSVPDHFVGRQYASRALVQAGVSSHAAETAIGLLSRGPAPSHDNMRGAVIMDCLSGERLESDQERGVRASRFDWTEKASIEIEHCLHAAGLSHHRTKEALGLATKMVHGPGVIAELCWSDDSDYAPGYTASRTYGYVRFPYLKAKGDPKGGRVLFVDRSVLDIGALVHYLEKGIVLIEKIGICNKAVSPAQYFCNPDNDKYI